MADLGDENGALATVTTEREAGRVRATVGGEIDMSNVDEVSQQLRRAVHGNEVLIVDLSRLAFIDSAGIAALHRLHRDLTGAGAQLRVVAGESSVAGRTLRLAGMDQVLPMDVEEGAS
jgi:anti-sigma B factor antagonist